MSDPQKRSVLSPKCQSVQASPNWTSYYVDFVLVVLDDIQDIVPHDKRCRQ